MRIREALGRVLPRTVLASCLGIAPADLRAQDFEDRPRTRGTTEPAWDHRRTPAAPARRDPGTTEPAWDLLFGRIPVGRDLVAGALGFSALAEVSVERAIGARASIGGAATFDYARNRPSRTGTPTMMLRVPLRISIATSDELTIGARAEPGIAVRFGDALELGFTVNIEGTAGVILSDELAVGAGVELPIGVFLGDAVTVSLPILFGPVGEYRLDEAWALTAELKLGTFAEGSTDGSRASVALKALVGLVRRY